jgi:NAD(P)-dependent dehydrogenase (short-subunit alcohol dehydrogenase family)
MAVVLITGCSSGIGLQTALSFSRHKHMVFASMRNLSNSDDLEKAAKNEGLAVEIVQLDVTDSASVEAAVAKVLDSAETIDVLVNNAGFGFHGPIEEADIDEAKLMFDTNFFGQLRLIQSVLPGMRERRSGTIVNISSFSGVLSEPYHGIYAASKHAVEAMSESLYYESHPFGIRVLVIEPGTYDTRGFRKAREKLRFAENSPHLQYGTRFMEAVKTVPGAGTPGDPKEAADAIYDAVYTDQPKLRYIVGEEEAHVLALRRQLTDEEFEQAMRTALDFWD